MTPLHHTFDCTSEREFPQILCLFYRGDLAAPFAQPYEPFTLFPENIRDNLRLKNKGLKLDSLSVKAYSHTVLVA